MMGIKNATYGFTIPQIISEIIYYAGSHEDTFCDTDLVTFFSSSLGFDFDFGMLIPYLNQEPFDSLDIDFLLNESIPTIYTYTPFEFAPVGWAGGNGLLYGYLILAPELEPEDYPMVSFAAIDGSGPVWLGDNTTQGLESLLSAKLKNTRLYEPKQIDEVYKNPIYQYLTRKYELNPNIDDPIIKVGARSDLRVKPLVPKGWHFQDDLKGVGVLAPIHQFNPNFNHQEYKVEDFESTFELGKEQLRLNYDASALYLFRLIYDEAFYLKRVTELASWMKKAYLKLDKKLLADNINTFLKSWQQDSTLFG